MDKSEGAASAGRESGVIGIIGCGQMGAGIAQIAAQAGYRVMLYDARTDAAHKASTTLSETWDRLVAKGRMEAAAADAARAHLQVADALEALAGCEVVVEAIVENLEAK